MFLLKMELKIKEDLKPLNELKTFSKNFIRKGKEKKVEDSKITELLTFNRENKLKFGAKICEKMFKQGRVEKIYTTKNCDELTLRKIKHYASISDIPVIELGISKSEFSEKVQKAFLISMACVVKSGGQK